MPIKNLGVNTGNYGVVLGVDEREVVIRDPILALTTFYKLGNEIFASPSAFEESVKECQKWMGQAKG